MSVHPENKPDDGSVYVREADVAEAVSTLISLLRSDDERIRLDATIALLQLVGAHTTHATDDED